MREAWRPWCQMLGLVGAPALLDGEAASLARLRQHDYPAACGGRWSNAGPRERAQSPIRQTSSGLVKYRPASPITGPKSQHTDHRGGSPRWVTASVRSRVWASMCRETRAVSARCGHASQADSTAFGFSTSRIHSPGCFFAAMPYYSTLISKVPSCKL